MSAPIVHDSTLNRTLIPPPGIPVSWANPVPFGMSATTKSRLLSCSAVTPPAAQARLSLRSITKGCRKTTTALMMATTMARSIVTPRISLTPASPEKLPSLRMSTGCIPFLT